MASSIGPIGGRIPSRVGKAKDAGRADRRYEVIPPGDDDDDDDGHNIYRQIINVDGVQFDLSAPRGTYLDIFI